MSRCDYDPVDLRCRVCGHQARRLPTFRECRPPPVEVWRPFMVGDFVERCLTRIGVTKERVERWTRTDGKSGGCGCEARQRWLNDAGVRVQVAARRLAQRYAKNVFG
jgi:hypothetical protein